MVPAKGALTRLEGLALLEPAHVGLSRLDAGGLELEVRLFFGGFLLADTGGLEEFGPARSRGPGQGQGGLGPGKLGSCLGQFLVQLRRVDFRQQVPFLYLGADIGQPAPEIAAGAGVDRRFQEGFDFGGQRQAGDRLAGSRGDEAHGLDGQFAGLGPQGGAALPARNQARNRADDDQQGRHDRPRSAIERWRWMPLRRWRPAAGGPTGLG